MNVQRTRTLVLLATVGGLFVVWGILHVAPLNALKDKSVDTSRILLSAVIYACLLNTLLWIPELWRQYRIQTLLSCGAVVVSVVLLHLLSFYVVPTSAFPRYRSFFSPSLHHIMLPSTRMYEGTYEGKQVFVDTNEDGLRTRYSRNTFASLRTRILVLGDSFAFGLGVKQDKVWPQLLEDSLRQRFGRTDIGVLNAGVISYSPVLEARQLDSLGPSYKPQLVILFLDPTDIGDDYSYERDFQDKAWSQYKAQPAALPSGLWLITEPLRGTIGSALSWPYDVVREHLLGSKPVADVPYDYYKMSIEIGGRVETNRFFIYRHPLDQTRPYFDVTWSNIQRIQELCRKLHAELIVVPNPRYHHWNRQECPDNWEHYAYSDNEPYQFEFFRYFTDRGISDGIEVFDLLQAFRSTTEFPLVFKNDPHYNEAGHNFVARTMADYLVQRHAPLLGGRPAEPAEPVIRKGP